MDCKALRNIRVDVAMSMHALTQRESYTLVLDT